MNSIFDLQITQKAMPDGSVCGPDLEYSPLFASLSALAAGQEERQVGGSVLPARDPDWSGVFLQGCQLLATSRDLRVLAITAQAATHQYGVRGWAQSVGLMESWLENYWDSVHPQLVLDGDFDPLLRSNVIAALSDANGLLQQLRRSPFLATPVGVITVADVERLVKGREVDDGAVVGSIQELREAIEKESASSQEVIASIREASRSIAAIEQHFHTKLDSEFWPDLSPLVALLNGLLGVLPKSAEEPSLNEPQSHAAVKSPDAPLVREPVNKPIIALPSELHSVSEAFSALALARRYFEKNEPSHPAPLLIKRVEKLNGKDFLSIVRELAPEALQQLQLIAGSDDAGAA